MMLPPKSKPQVRTAELVLRRASCLPVKRQRGVTLCSRGPSTSSSSCLPAHSFLTALWWRRPKSPAFLTALLTMDPGTLGSLQQHSAPGQPWPDLSAHLQRTGDGSNFTGTPACCLSSQHLPLFPDLATSAELASPLCAGTSTAGPLGCRTEPSSKSGIPGLLSNPHFSIHCLLQLPGGRTPTRSDNLSMASLLCLPTR